MIMKAAVQKVGKGPESHDFRAVTSAACIVHGGVQWSLEGIDLDNRAAGFVAFFGPFSNIIYIPFIIIDLVVASVLMSMGMMMLSPMMISLPFKLLLFVLVDGWGLITSSLVSTFIR